MLQHEVVAKEVGWGNLYVLIVNYVIDMKDIIAKNLKTIKAKVLRHVIEVKMVKKKDQAGFSMEQKEN